MNILEPSTIKLTDSFQANNGGKQILSPLLFHIFLADIVEHFGTELYRPLKIDESSSYYTRKKDLEIPSQLPLLT